MHQTGRLLGAMVVGLTLSGCTPNPFSEAFTFRYKYAQRLGNADVYAVRVLRGNTSQPCANQVEDRMRLEQIAFTVQRLGLDSLINACHERFQLDVETTRQLRDPVLGVPLNLVRFEFRPLAGGGASVFAKGQAGLASNTFPTVLGITITTNGDAPVGQKVTDGAAEITFGGAGPTYRCTGRAGQEFWDQHIADPLTDTFFEFTLTSRDAARRLATAEFQCLARNITDVSDTRLLLVMSGSIIIDTDN